MHVLDYNRLYLAVPKASLVGFIHQEDRERFSRPIEVEYSHSNVCTQMLYVKDLSRGLVFPVDKKHIRRGYQLTYKQRKVIDLVGR